MADITGWRSGGVAGRRDFQRGGATVEAEAEHMSKIVKLFY